MKLTTFILIVLFTQVGAKGFSQVTLHENNVPLEKVLRLIKEQSGYTFSYESEILNNRMVTVHVNNATVEAALSSCLNKLPIIYQVIGQNVVLQKKKTSLSKQKMVINGVVVDENDKPLTNATLKMVDNSRTWITGVNGNFLIELPEDITEAVISVSYLGYKTQYVKISQSANLTIKMVPDFANLNQVLVVGYGTSTRRNLTGSVFKVDATTLEKVPTNDPVLALQGRVPGLQITPSSGLPGADATVQIRGINSLNRAVYPNNGIDRSNTPLYIIDGVPFISEPLNVVSDGLSIFSPNNTGINSVIFSSPFKSINPADIESIEVLKDADATSIYGARGANGVILITTKRGKSGKTKLDVDVYNGISQVPKFIDVFDTQQYLAMRREAFRNDSLFLGPLYSPPSSDPSSFGFAPDLTLWDQNAYTNWQKKYAGEKANSLNVQATLSGGTEQTRFLFNTGYRKQSTVYPGNFGLEQGSLRFNFDHTSLDKKFNLSFSSAYSADLNKNVSVDPFQYFNLSPNFPIYNPDGSLNWITGRNPEADFLRTSTDRTTNLIGNLSLGYQILKNLNLKLNGGYNKIQLDQVQLIPVGYYTPNTGSTGNRFQGSSNSATYLVEPQLNYQLRLSDHSIQVLAGGTYQQTESISQYFTGTGYTNDELLGDLASATSVSIRPLVDNKYRYLSVFGRLSYNWKGKYLANLTARRDGSSRFGPSKRYGTFGALGAAWIFTEEAWMKNLSFLSFGKLRGSYGTTGNDKIGDYQYYDTWKATPVVYQTAGSYSTKLFNPDYQWETNKKLEAAVELGFFKDRISLTVDYYRNRSGNQLVNYPVASQAGYDGVTANLDALVQNSGWEFDLNTTNVKTLNFTWNTAFNFSLQRNKLIRFPNLAGSPYRFIYQEGASISNIQGYLFEGVDPQTGNAIYKDIDNNGSFDGFQSPDQTVIANSLPSFYGGINNTFTYRGWQLDVFFNYRKLDKVPYGGLLLPGSQVNSSSISSGRWQKPGDQADLPMYTNSFFNPVYIDNILNLISSTRVLYSGSYIRLSNASLSYKFSEKWLKAIGIQQLRLYGSAQNLFTLSDFPGPDPETGLGMPSLRTVVIGTKITF